MKVDKNNGRAERSLTASFLYGYIKNGICGSVIICIRIKRVILYIWQYGIKDIHKKYKVVNIYKNVIPNSLSIYRSNRNI